MKLHELDADKLLEILEQRQEEYAEAKERAGRTSFALERIQKGSYMAIRKAEGLSIEDSKAAALNSDMVIVAFNEDMEAQREKDRTLFALERVRIAIDLFRSIRADMRGRV